MRDGKVVKIRGDEALAVFESARQAIRAAKDLQEMFASRPTQIGTFPCASESASTPERRSSSKTPPIVATP
jgi:hypothetical protein